MITKVTFCDWLDRNGFTWKDDAPLWFPTDKVLVRTKIEEDYYWCCVSRFRRTDDKVEVSFNGPSPIELMKIDDLCEMINRIGCKR